MILQWPKDQLTVVEKIDRIQGSFHNTDAIAKNFIGNEMASFNALDEIKDKVDAVEAKINTVEAKIEAKINAVEAKVDTLSSDVSQILEMLKNG
jgi:uncharacterized membrane protein